MSCCVYLFTHKNKRKKKFKQNETKYDLCACKWHTTMAINTKKNPEKNSMRTVFIVQFQSVLNWFLYLYRHIDTHSQEHWKKKMIILLFADFLGKLYTHFNWIHFVFGFLFFLIWNTMTFPAFKQLIDKHHFTTA